MCFPSHARSDSASTIFLQGKFRFRLELPFLDS
jgi:hypothetical protein